MTKDRTMQLTTGLTALAIAVVLVRTSACPDDDNDSFSFGLESTQNSPPVISGTPRIKARAGERYLFPPRGVRPDGPPPPFRPPNLPGWLRFHAGRGRISGTPRRNNVGTFGDGTHSVSD